MPAPSRWARSPQGIRRAAPTLGETIVVVGLGLLGQLTVQMLRANGCIVVGIDPDAARRDLAVRCGAAQVLDPAAGGHVEQVRRSTDGAGADAVIITAAGAGNAIVSEAFVTQFWPGVPHALGRRLRMGDEKAPWITVVGVARDVRHIEPDRSAQAGSLPAARAERGACHDARG